MIIVQFSSSNRERERERSIFKHRSVLVKERIPNISMIRVSKSNANQKRKLNKQNKQTKLKKISEDDEDRNGIHCLFFSGFFPKILDSRIDNEREGEGREIRKKRKKNSEKLSFPQNTEHEEEIIEEEW